MYERKQNSNAALFSRVVAEKRVSEAVDYSGYLIIHRDTELAELSLMLALN